MDKLKINRVTLYIALHIFFAARLSSSTEFQNSNDLTELVDILEKMQLPVGEQTEPNQRVPSLDRMDNRHVKLPIDNKDILPVEGVDDLISEGSQQYYPKSKRGWEELNRSWRSYFPKRAWDVVRNYWRNPRIRSAYKNYLVKRNMEELVHVPVQPDNENDKWMLDEVAYKVDNDNKVVPDTFAEDGKVTKREWGDIEQSNDAHPLKRGWEDIRLFGSRYVGKRGSEDARSLANEHPVKREWGDIEQSNDAHPLKRGWEDIRLFGSRYVGKRGSEDTRSLANEHPVKRGWEDVRLFANSHYGNVLRYFPNARRGKRGWEDIRLFPGARVGKRGWEDIRLFPGGPVGKRGWEDIRLFPGARPGKRGWEDVRLFSGAPIGKRGWEDIRLFGKRGWEDVRLFSGNNLGKRGRDDTQLIEGCGCCESVSSPSCCVPCKSETHRRSVRDLDTKTESSLQQHQTDDFKID